MASLVIVGMPVNVQVARALLRMISLIASVARTCAP